MALDIDLEAPTHRSVLVRHGIFAPPMSAAARAVLVRYGLAEPAACVIVDGPDDDEFVPVPELPSAPAACEHGSMWCPACDGATDEEPTPARPARFSLPAVMFRRAARRPAKVSGIRLTRGRTRPGDLAARWALTRALRADRRARRATGEGRGCATTTWRLASAWRRNRAFVGACAAVALLALIVAVLIADRPDLLVPFGLIAVLATAAWLSGVVRWGRVA